MYRFSIDEEEWILRFRTPEPVDLDKQEIILRALTHFINDLSLFSHGEAFLIVIRNIGAVIFKVERIPSQIIIVSYIIAKENWYHQKG